MEDWSTEFDSALRVKSERFYGREVVRHVTRLPGPDPVTWLRDSLNTSLQRHQWIAGVDRKPVRLWCDFVDHDGINACAFAHDGLLAIAVHLPAVAGLQQIFSEILQRSDIYPEAGPREELKPLEPDTLSSLARVSGSDGSERVKAVDAGIPLSMPNSPQRFHFATFVHRLALDVLYFHELQHILLGHVGYLDHQFGPRAVFEVPPTRESMVDDAELHKKLEFTADFMAGASMADGLVSHSFVLAGGVETVDDPDELLARDGKLAELILFASGVLFSTLESQLVAQGLQGTQG